VKQSKDALKILINKENLNQCS